MKLFQRKATLTVDTIQIPDDLRFVFQVEKTLAPEPNTAEIHVFNLNAAHRAQIEKMKSVPVKLEAGYKEGTSQLFLGDLRTALTVRDGSDLVTTLASGDGEKAIKGARVNTSFGPNVTADTVLLALAKALGVGLGNVPVAALKLRLSGAASMYIGGCAMSGSVARELTDLCDSGDLEWSVQDGNLQIVDRGKALEGTAVLLTSDTGLLGSPRVDSEGALNGTCLLIPDMRPGRLISVLTENVKGFYRLERVQYAGDTQGEEWYITFEAKPVQLV